MNPKRTSRGLLIATLVGVSLSASLAGCMSEEEVGKVEAALSAPGPWVIPAETTAIGDAQYVEYTSAGAWVGTSGCAPGVTPGAVTLKDWLEDAFPQVRSIGGYSCRSINGDSSRMSVHGTGRALDIMLPLHDGDADNDLGDPIGNYLIEHAEEIGIQYIIWDRWTWNASRAAGSKDRRYGGAHPHHDHLHVELSVDAAAMRTPWFSGSMDTPAAGGCDTTIPADGGVVDNTSSCFSAFGNASYWRDVSGAGHGGSLMWTNAFQSESPSNWARWRLDLEAAGQYAVEVAVDPAWGVYGATRYSVLHGGSEDVVTVDQGASAGWIRLGVYRFAAGAGQYVNVYDNASGSVAAEQHVVADAVRLVPLSGPAPEPEPEPAPEPGPEPEPEPSDPPTMDGGDPMIDDDPLDPNHPSYRGEGVVTGGCSAAVGSPAVASVAPVLSALGVLLVLSRRRRRRRRV
ncbi:MAG: hypothetical protein DRJ42_18730 [Deltaproteobacteria bacterium]|nr:MAG: hypothetical protein DRJ42_18730 [Deltaproteobacteria bacterium]